MLDEEEAVLRFHSWHPRLLEPQTTTGILEMGQQNPWYPIPSTNTSTNQMSNHIYVEIGCGNCVWLSGKRSKV